MKLNDRQRKLASMVAEDCKKVMRLAAERGKSMPSDKIEFVCERVSETKARNALRRLADSYNPLEEKIVALEEVNDLYYVALHFRSIADKKAAPKPQ